MSELSDDMDTIGHDECDEKIDALESQLSDARAMLEKMAELIKRAHAQTPLKDCDLCSALASYEEWKKPK